MRGSARSIFGWAFGISLSILFVSVWGRAVVVDTDTLGESLAPLSGTEAVADYVTDWIRDELVQSGVDPSLVDPTIDRLMDSSPIGGTLDRFVVDVVRAAASSDAEGSSVDMQALVTPVVPELTSGLNEVGVSVSTDQVEGFVDYLDPLVIREPGSQAIVGPDSPTAKRLGIAFLLASLAIVVFGTLVVYLSEDRVSAVRGLFQRVAVGGLSFAVFLRVGSWVADPGGGRAPVREALSALADSKWVLPLQIALIAAAIAGLIFVVRWLFRRWVANRSPSEQSTRSPERSRSLSGSR